MVFSSAARLVLDSLASAGGVSVVYSRGSETTGEITATRGSTRTENVSDGEASLFTHREDFLIKATDIDFGSGAVEPKPGDRITVGSDVYEVAPIGSETCARRSDREGYYWRIHVNRING